MTITFTSGAPKNTLEKLVDWIPKIQNIALASGTEGGAVINLSQGYKVIYPSLQNVVLGKLFDTENTSRWRHLVVSEPIVYGEIELDDSTEPFALHQGEGKNGFKAAIERANKLSGDYEASVIEIPALHFIGLWLHNPEKDFIMPYPPNLTELKNYEITNYAEALSLLQAMAKDVLNASAGSESTGS
jgi:hypothetical protein